MLLKRQQSGLSEENPMSQAAQPLSSSASQASGGNGTSNRLHGLFGKYAVDDFYDEMFSESGDPRQGCKVLYERILSLAQGKLIHRQQAAEHALMQMGITFRVNSDDGESAVERIFPFDILPRIINADEWNWIERGLKQRIHALNLFIADVYGDQKIFRDNVVPKEIVLGSSGYLAPCDGLKVPRGIWCHITGTDLVRDSDGQIYVLEDNLRCPSGVSYVLQNRRLMKQIFPQLFVSSNIRPVENYCSRLLAALEHIGTYPGSNQRIALLTPGVYNSAYFEHSYLAQQMGIDLVEGQDLVVKDGYVHVRSTQGLERVDVIYRRIDDTFLDPEVFREDSMLGVPGLMDAYRAGHVALANAPGTGVADDKVVYAYVPQIIKYYLGEDPIIPNVPTYLCWDEKQRSHVLDNLDKLVVKPAAESGGYGMLIGPHAEPSEHREFANRIQKNPRNYIAQPTLSLSRVPVVVDHHLEGRHVDLRPFIVYGEDIFVVPGGLTRVALRKNSLVVNSSQGGGSKDTWVLANEH